MIIDKGLYGLQSSAARFHDKLAASLRKMGFKPCKADFDLWMRNKGDHYEYLAVYVDDILVFSRDPMKVIETIRNEYDLKGVGAPEYYLGGDIDTMSSNATTKDVEGIEEVDHDVKDKHLSIQWLKQGIKTAFSARTYIKNTVERLERMMNREFGKFDTPMSETLHPEIDDSPTLDEVEHNKFRSIVGSANWLVTLGRFDIAYSVNAFSRHSMNPCQGHLTGMIRVFGYLKKNQKGRILIDPNYPKHSNYPTPECDNWKEFYPDAEEHMPDVSEIPDGKGPVVRMTVFKDADHAHDILTRRSVTGILLMINNTPVCWISKSQKTAETTMHGSELVAEKQAIELILEYCYMFRMMGARIEKSALLLGDNNSVVLNTTMPSSVLKKKHCAVSYHKIREAIAAGIVRFTHIRSENNYADVLTKPLSPKEFRNLVLPLLFRNP